MAMNKWKPPSAEAAAAFAAATANVAGFERRKMFGYDCTFANSRMVAGLHEVGMVLRLPDADRERFQAEYDAPPFVVMGRVMREYVVIPESLQGDPRTLERWVRRGLAYAESMPPKEKSRSAARKASKKEPTPKKPASKKPAPKKPARPKVAATKKARSTKPRKVTPRSMPSKAAPGRKH